LIIDIFIYHVLDCMLASFASAVTAADYLIYPDAAADNTC